MKHEIPTFNTDDEVWTLDFNRDTGESSLQRYKVCEQLRYNFTNNSMYSVCPVDGHGNHKLIEADELYATKQEAIDALIKKLSDALETTKTTLSYDEQRLADKRKSITNMEASLARYRNKA